MAEVKIFVKIDGVEYTQDQLKDLATGSKKAADGMENVADETKKAGDEQGFFAKKMAGVFKSLPDREDILPDINENLVVELYSK